MNLQQFKKLSLPKSPGVYTFLGKKGEILYIGKATSLRDRVRSYFDTKVTETRGTHMMHMVEETKTVKFETTDSVLEALILEAYLIRKHQPRFNTKEKDDKSFNYVVITKEDFPRVLLIRGKELFDPRKKPDYEMRESFGPFPHGTALKEALRIVRKIFPYRDTCVPLSGKPCFNAQIGLCPGVCSGAISKTEYAKTIRNISLFFQGKKKTAVTNLTRDMRTASKALDFERAARLKRQIFALGHINDVSLIKSESPGEFGIRIEGYDVAHISGTNPIGVMTVISNGEPDKTEYRTFNIKSFEGVNDPRALTEILDRRLEHPEWQYPRIIVVDGAKAQKNAAENILKARGVRIPIVSVVKDERHKPKGFLGDKKLIEKNEKAILLANSEAHRFSLARHRQKRGKMPS